MNGSSWIRFAQRSGYSGLFLVTLATSPSALGEIRSADCARAAKYSESKRGASVLVMQNGRTIFEHYANDGSAGGRDPGRSKQSRQRRQEEGRHAPHGRCQQGVRALQVVESRE